MTANKAALALAVFDRCFSANNEYGADYNFTHGEIEVIRAALTPKAAQEWRPIESAPRDGTRMFLASYIIPSEEAQRNGSKPYWDMGYGSYMEKAKIWTGILGGKPSHWKSALPPPPAREG